MTRSCSMFLVLAALIAPGTATADDTAEARRHFDRALGLVDDGQMAEALIEFRRSYEIDPRYQVLYNIGQAHIALAQPVEAADALARYLTDGGTAVPKQRRAEVEKEIARQQSRIATLDLTVSPATATVRVDGVAVAAGPVRVGVGTHLVAATLDGYARAEVSVTVAGEDRRAVELTLSPLAVPAAAVEPAPAPVAASSPAPLGPLLAPTPAEPAASPLVVALPAEPEAARPSRLRALGYGAIAAGLLSLGAGGGFWLYARSQHEHALEHCPADRCDGEAAGLQSKAQDAVVWANVLGFGGAALVAGGAALVYFGRPGAVAARVTPAAGPGFAALVAEGVF